MKKKHSVFILIMVLISSFLLFSSCSLKNPGPSGEGNPEKSSTEYSSDDKPSAALDQDDSADSYEENIDPPNINSDFDESKEGSMSQTPVNNHVVQGENTYTNETTISYVNGTGVRMREAPSTQANILLYLTIGTKVELIGNDGTWSKVRYLDTTGYIRNDLLSKTKPESTVEIRLINQNSQDPITSPKIIVKKGKRILELWDSDRLYESYPIGLGRNPEGPKEKEGDGRTPEGSYYVCTRNSQSRFYLSLGVSYPNKEDARNGLESGLINNQVYKQISDAIDQKAQPPWNTALGGEIMIHGHGSASDWTAGCIAVDNEVMDILWRHCPLGTPILIIP